jgi:chromosome partitioning protein
MGKIIAVAVPKGGVGKTTTAINLAASLAVAEKKTIIIDFDSSGACSIALGFTPDKITGDIFQVLSLAKSIEKVIHHTTIPLLDFIPACVTTYTLEQRLDKLSNNMMFIVNTIRSIEMRYDYIIIDCPPFIRGMTTNALAAADSILIPMRAETFSLHALGKMLDHIEYVRKAFNPMLKIEGIFFTMYEPKTKVSAIAMAELETNYKQYLLRTIIPKNVAITEATFHGIPVVLYNAVSKGAQAYLGLAAEIMSNKQKSYEIVSPPKG